MDFLDTTVKFDTNYNLYTTLYTKPTDTHTYLHFTSAHPPHHKKVDPLVSWYESNVFVPNKVIMLQIQKKFWMTTNVEDTLILLLLPQDRMQHPYIGTHC